MKTIFYIYLTFLIFTIIGLKVLSADSIEDVKLRADQGDEVAQLQVGRYYENISEFTKALEYYSLSAQQGNAFAEYNIGRVYEYGIGVKADWHEAAKWYIKANEQGIPLPPHQIREEE